jgi:hypothetical protein
VFAIDDDTYELLEKFDKKIQPKILKVIDKIDKKKELFSILFEKNSKIKMQRMKESGQMSVDSECDRVSDTPCLAESGMLESMSELIKIDIKPQSIKHESLLPEEEFKRVN